MSLKVPRMMTLFIDSLACLHKLLAKGGRTGGGGGGGGALAPPILDLDMQTLCADNWLARPSIVPLLLALILYVLVFQFPLSLALITVFICVTFGTVFVNSVNQLTL